MNKSILGIVLIVSASQEVYVSDALNQGKITRKEARRAMLNEKLFADAACKQDAHESLMSQSEPVAKDSDLPKRATHLRNSDQLRRDVVESALSAQELLKEAQKVSKIRIRKSFDKAADFFIDNRVCSTVPAEFVAEELTKVVQKQAVDGRNSRQKDTAQARTQRRDKKVKQLEQ